MCKNKASEKRMDNIYFNYLKNYNHVDIIAYWQIIKILCVCMNVL